eukprot:SAG22_NODE_468_length_10147_cov_77.238654_2_plen_216_part_00
MHAPPGVHLFTRTVAAANGQVVLQLDGCGKLTVDAQHDEHTLLQLVMTREAEHFNQVNCIPPPAPSCSGWGPDDEGMLILWIMLAAAGGLGILTVTAMVHGERIRRRRQFQLVEGPPLALGPSARPSVGRLPSSSLRAPGRPPASVSAVESLNASLCLPVCLSACLPEPGMAVLRDGRHCGHEPSAHNRRLPRQVHREARRAAHHAQQLRAPWLR